MMIVRLAGSLTCTSDEQLRSVIEHLPEHIRLTRLEPGCLSFEVVQREDDPMVWTVEERFADQAAFGAHQERTRASVWARETRDIARDYIVITEPSSAPR
ncbi:MAG: antibiotic biosynthesis monooxygenase [Devosia sp.]|jgi:quinol monooxygenase YgiN|uniref:putative quinol monooxygenase n=1 Tax=unclassified Devosia TaxID=196773 RepID=UPI0019ED9F90|nr:MULTISPECIES: antibiotic biosynthesis monooxygenase [unclassified Devosia]MBF0678308.1 antibiotic biosynthesis monooxygenase [Devosia sp.]WEJ31562.1 antibiotic biosynthesis monooxygenase [Devosia sp. SD17-2]